MRPPIFVRPLTDAEHPTVERGLRSSDAYVLRRCQIPLASAWGERAPRIAAQLGCDDQTVLDVVHAFTTVRSSSRQDRACASCPAHCPSRVLGSTRSNPSGCAASTPSSSQSACLAPRRWPIAFVPTWAARLSHTSLIPTRQQDHALRCSEMVPGPRRGVPPSQVDEQERAMGERGGRRRAMNRPISGYSTAPAGGRKIASPSGEPGEAISCRQVHYEQLEDRKL